MNQDDASEEIELAIRPILDALLAEGRKATADATTVFALTAELEFVLAKFGLIKPVSTDFTDLIDQGD